MEQGTQQETLLMSEMAIPHAPVAFDAGTQPLTVATLEEGAVLERVEEAFSDAMQTAMRMNEKASITLTIVISPDKKSEEEEFNFDSTVKKNLPAIKGNEVRSRGRNNIAYTDLKSQGRILREIGGGRYEDVATGDPVVV